MNIIDVLNNVVGIALIIMMASFVFKENVFYRVCERTFVALAITFRVSAGIILIQNYFSDILKQGGPALLSLIWAPLGVMILFQATKGRYFYLSRLPIAIFMGSQMGLILRGRIHTSILQSIIGIIKPFTPENMLFIVMSLTAIFYFTYSFEHKGPLKIISDAGLISVMIYMGSIFGTLTIKRLSYLGNAINWILTALRNLGLFT